MKLVSEQPSITCDEGIHIIGFFNSKSDEYFMIQWSLEYTEQDRRLGMATYYIERNDQIYSCYGGIESIELVDGSLKIRLSSKAIQYLKTSTVEITWEPDETKYQELVASFEILLK